MQKMGVKGKTYEDTVKTIKIAIVKLFQQFDYLLVSDKINGTEKKYCMD